MKIFEIMKMELKFISSQGFTSLLILLYPFVLMLVVGPVFASIGTKNVLISVYSEVNEPLPELESQYITVVSSREDMIADVLSGQAALGIYLAKDANGRKHMYSYFDPSKKVVANALALQLQGKLSDVSAELVETNLVTIWKNMRVISADIDQKLRAIPALRTSLQNSASRMRQFKTEIQTQQITSTSESLAQIRSDASSMRQSISQMQAKLPSWENSINEISNYDSKLQYYDSRLASTDSQLYSLQNQLGGWDSKLSARISQLDNAYNTLSTYLQIVRQLKASATGEQYNSLQQVENGMIDSMNQVSSARAELVQMRNELAQILSQIQAARNDIASARSDIATTRASLQNSGASARNDLNSVRSGLNDAASRLGSADSNIQQAQDNLNSFTDFATSMDKYLTTSENELLALSAELDSTEKLLRNAKSNIDTFISNDPQRYIPPKMEYLQGTKILRDIDSLMPALIALVSMLSCLLLPPIMAVKQKTQGMRMRMRLSYASPFSIVAGRFLGDYIIGVIQVIVIAVAGSVLFGVNMGSNYTSLVLGLLLAPAVFTALGTLLASFISNEGSAVLSSLLLSMPMLFLSGILLPIEQFSSSFRFIASTLPLYHVVEMISKVTIRDAAQYAASNFLACGMYLFVFLFLSYTVWRNKE
ncbi:MAG: ABC transporter permease [Candidatus Micrarchaeota archaeon]